MAGFDRLEERLENLINKVLNEVKRASPRWIFGYEFEKDIRNINSLLEKSNLRFEIESEDRLRIVKKRIVPYRNDDIARQRRKTRISSRARTEGSVEEQCVSYLLFYKVFGLWVLGDPFAGFISPLRGIKTQKIRRAIRHHQGLLATSATKGPDIGRSQRAMSLNSPWHWMPFPLRWPPGPSWKPHPLLDQRRTRAQATRSTSFH